MTLKDNQNISAQVIVKSASGKSGVSASNITASTIEERTSSPEFVKTARRIFQKAGFDVGNFVGISFSITANASTFKKFFQIDLTQTSRGSIEFLLPGGESRPDLPEAKIPKTLTGIVEGITFTPPLDFGPVSFM